MCTAVLEKCGAPQALLHPKAQSWRLWGPRGINNFSGRVPGSQPAQAHEVLDSLWGVWAKVGRLAHPKHGGPDPGKAQEENRLRGVSPWKAQKENRLRGVGPWKTQKEET